MPRKPSRPRVLGPYKDGPSRWRVVVRTGPRERADYTCETEAAALRLKRALELELVQPCELVGKAIVAYREYQQRNGNLPNSISRTEHALCRFFRDPDISLDMLTPKLCERYYRQLVDEGLAVSTHRNYLLEARSFLRWCEQEKGWIPKNPLAKVKGEGKRRKGKPQLRVAEARKLFETCLKAAQEGDVGAAAVLCALVLGLRASEITQRVVRDLDDDGRLLWIDVAKTEAGRRVVEVPDPLREVLLGFTKGRRSDQPLLGRYVKKFKAVVPHRREWVGYVVEKWCKEAGVTVVCPHGLRGTHASIAREAGATGYVVASTLGHESERITDEAYTRPEAIESARVRAGLKVLTGGKG